MTIFESWGDIIEMQLVINQILVKSQSEVTAKYFTNCSFLAWLAQFLYKKFQGL